MTDLSGRLLELRDLLAGTEFPLELGEVDEARTTRVELIDQLDDYVLPRLARLDAPLLAVLGGSTGAGKSTITNSIVGKEVTRPGVTRPTTRTPVLICNPDDREWFVEGGVLADLPRSTGEHTSTGAGLHIVVADTLPAGLALLDSPDIDSVETANHELAAQLLGAADLWLFTTTAARYADAVPWSYLRRARERSSALALIINRVPPGAVEEIVPHLRSMLADNGLGEAHVFPVVEQDLVDGRIEADLDGVIEWLTSIVGDAVERDRLVRSTLDGALDSIEGRVERLGGAVGAQAGAASALAAHAQMRYEQALGRIDTQLSTGELLKGEILDQWKDIVGTGEVMDWLQRSVGRLRDGITSLFTGREQPEEVARGELESNLEVLVRAVGDEAALEVVEGWEALPGGPQALTAADRGLDRASPDLNARVATTIEAWQDGVLEMVEELAGPKLAVARTLSLGINSVGVALMIAVFSSTGGVTGGEVAVAGGTAAVSQTVLSAVFGEQAVRDLVELSRDDLMKRLRAEFDLELERFDRLLWPVPNEDDAQQMSAASANVAAART